LTVNETELDDASVVGEECHIISPKPDGPRHDPAIPARDLDKYPNLILLCGFDHKTIDDQKHTYDVATLRRMKSEHVRRMTLATQLAPLLAEDWNASDPHEFVESYGREFRVFHESNLQSLIPTPIQLNERTTTATELLDSCRAGPLVISGDSGCGKSHLLRHMSLGVLGAKEIPVFARASAFGGNLEQLLDRAVAPFRNASYDALRRAGLRVGKRLYVVIDALNECPPALRDRLRESIAALAKKTDHTIWISSTDDPHLIDSLQAGSVKFLPLTEVDREAIFSSYAPRVMLDRSALAAFSTPFELAVAAETVRENEGRISAFHLLQRFTQKRLQVGDHPIHAHVLLERASEEMSRTFRATLSRRTLSRLANEKSSTDPAGDVDVVIRSGLLRSYGNDVAFMHEQVQIFFEAVSFLSVHGLLQIAEVATPANRRIASYVLGGLEQEDEIRACSAALCDSQILAGMIAGTFGARVQLVAKQDAIVFLKQSTDAVSNTPVTIHHDGRRLSFDSTTVTFEHLRPLDEHEVTLAVAIGKSARRGDFLSEILILLARTEGSVYAVAAPADRPAIFASLFVFGKVAQNCAASVIMQASSMGWFDASDRVLQIIHLLEPLPVATDAGLYLACSLLKHSDIKAPDALRIFNEAWSRGIYHVGLTALDLIQSRRSRATDDEANEIREELRRCESDNIMMNTAIIDVMLSYDMIESPVSPVSAGDEVRAILTMPDSDETYELAYGIVARCFEEVFQNVYFEALSKLPQHDEAVLLTRAAMCTDASFYVDWILQRLIHIGDECAVVAYSRFASGDPANVFDRQSMAVAWLLSVGACALLQRPFIAFPSHSKSHEAWRTLANIVYVMNSGQNIEDGVGELWNALISRYACDVIEPLMEIQYRGKSAVDLNIWRRFPDESRRLLEQVVRNEFAITSIHEWTHWTPRDAAVFVLGHLATVGNGDTVELLRPFVSHTEWGVPVVEAIRGIEARR
jgi:hypothetical protein